jgi:superfamily II DNA or RNA helicase
VVDVLNEGADFPGVECLLFLRPTESKRIFVQQLGRGLRRSVGKSHCVVIDFISNFKNA